MRKAIDAGKHISVEKPIAPSLADALDHYRRAQAAGVKHGVVQDELWLPGLLKLGMLIDSGFFGRLLSVRGKFGYWVFEGDARSIRSIDRIGAWLGRVAANAVTDYYRAAQAAPAGLL